MTKPFDCYGCEIRLQMPTVTDRSVLKLQLAKHAQRIRGCTFSACVGPFDRAQSCNVPARGGLTQVDSDHALAEGAGAHALAFSGTTDIGILSELTPLVGRGR